MNDQYPEGDQGGNLELLPNICDATNLHAVWDSLAYLYCGYPSLPISESNWNWYSSVAAGIGASNPVDEAEVYDGDFQKWADISFEIAKTQVYPSKY